MKFIIQTAGAGYLVTVDKNNEQTHADVYAAHVFESADSLCKWLCTALAESQKPPRKPRKSRAKEAQFVGDGGCLAECFPAIRSANEGAHAECGANAKLIAAAPDLLAALVAAHAQLADVELMLPGDFITPVLENASAAIAKAMGAPA